MPTLDWIGKQAVLHHHRDVPYRLIHCDKDLSAGDPDAGNLLVQGDNLEALKALLPYYAGKVKCIYIDPPYNTGNEGWIYNDNVNSPEMKKWLGQVVGKEAEDLSRHDKWLCMMYPRLRLLYDFLCEDGILLCSISDEEIDALKYLLSEIFKRSNFLASFIWVNEGNIDNQSKIKQNHEYVISFCKRERDFDNPSVIDPNIDESSKLKNEAIINTIVKNGPKNPISKIFLPAGFPANFENGTIALNPKEDFWPKLSSPIEVKNFRTVNSVHIESGWSSKALCELFIASGFRPVSDKKGQPTNFYITESGAVYLEKRRSTEQSHVLTVLNNMGTVQEAAGILEEMGVHFSYPKPHRLISYLLAVGSDTNSLVLDSFAGSGTTGHAVLDLNKQDGGNRKFILVEMDEKIAGDVTAERLKRVVNGYDKTKGEKTEHVEGLGSGFRFCRLGTPLFDEFGGIANEVTYPDLAAHIFFSETGSPIPQKADETTTLLGTYQGRAIYLLYDAATQGFALDAAGNTLTPAMLGRLPSPAPDFSGLRVVYAEGCTVTPERLREENVVFKQIPYQIGGA